MKTDTGQNPIRAPTENFSIPHLPGVPPEGEGWKSYSSIYYNCIIFSNLAF